MFWLRSRSSEWHELERWSQWGLGKNVWLVCCLQFAMLQETPEACWVDATSAWERITITNGLAAVKLDSAPADAWRAHYL